MTERNAASVCEWYGKLRFDEGRSIRFAATLTRVAFAAAAATTPALAQEGVALVPSVAPGFTAGTWLNPEDPIELALSQPLPPERGRLAVFVGETDLTSLFTVTSDRLTYRPTAIRLPSGESEIVVHLVGADNQWQVIGRVPIRIRTRSGFERAMLDPKLDVGNEGQVAEGHNPVANRPPRDTYQDFTTNAGVSTVHVRNGWTVQSQVNVTGVSHRQKALRFPQEGDHAPHVDLAEYRVDVEKGGVRASLGHLTWGEHRHLIKGFGSRGASMSVRLGRRADLTAAWLSGSSIVGWSNFLGVARRQHRLGGASFGLEAFPARPGMLRLETTVMTGSLLPISGFSQGVINDAETSRGWGVRLVATTPGQRGRLEAGYSRSRFDNPQDPLLDQGANIVAVRETTRSARYLEASYNVLQALPISPTVQGRLTAAYRHERADPLYRTVAAVIQADRSNDVFELQGGLGELTFQLSHTRYRDNLDEVPSILITRGRDYAFNLTAPLAFVFGVARRPAWLPALVYSYQRTHQKGDGVPDNSGARPTFVPDQVNTVHGAGLEWQGGTWRIAYRLDRSAQDNRQPEREQADNANLVQSVSLGFTPTPSLTLGLDLGLDLADNKEIDRTNQTRRSGVAIEWRATSMTSLGVRWSLTEGDDDTDLRENGSSDLTAQVTQRLNVFRLAGSAQPGQVYIRIGRVTSRALDREFQVDDTRRNWTASTGLTFTLF